MSNLTERLGGALRGRYEIEGELGEGGMAVVFLAQDLKHDRQVALKVLKPELAAVVGAERFLTEIKTTANLQHPHILPLFDSGEAEGFLFYVMPYIEGETLRERIDRDHQLPVDEALGIATAVASALQVAHENGVVHRDIKPGNILMSRGEPLVADFGIALAVGAASGNRLTETGLSVGTPYYMSPEQATGDTVVGPASDIYALACVLYEVLVGEPPYSGTTAQAVLGKIIQGDTVSAISVRKSIPRNVDAALRKALEKLPADRFSSAREFARALADPNFRHGEGDAEERVGVPGRWKGVAVGVGALALVLAGLLAWTAFRPEPPARVERFDLAPAEGQGLDYNFDLAGDGSVFVFQVERNGVTQLASRRVGDLDAVAVPGTENGTFPSLSPDGTEVAFVAGGELKVAPVVGGVVRTLTDGVACCARWGMDGHISFSDGERFAARIPAAGGEVEILTTRQEEGDGLHGRLELLPGGPYALTTVWGGSLRIDAVNLESGERHAVTQGAKPVVLEGGYLVFGSTDGEILVARIDPGTATLDGPAVPLVEGVRVDSDEWPYFSVARDGTLVYWTGAAEGAADARVVRVDREGTVTPVDPEWTFDPGAPEVSLRVSPDGTRLAVMISGEAGDDIWVKQLDDGPLSRLTFHPERDWRPWWSADGRWVYFISFRNGNLDLFRKRSDGTGEPELVLDRDGHVAEAILTPDGEWLIARVGGSQGGTDIRDLVGLRVSDTTGTLVPLAAEPYDEKAAALSPDGRWLAYESTETGRDEVYIRPFPAVEQGKWQVSSGGAVNPRWSHDGRELFYVTEAGEMVAAELDLSEGVSVVRRATLFDVEELGLYANANYAGWDVAPDDQHVYMTQFGSGEDGQQADNRFILVQGWFGEVRTRLGGR